MNNKKLITIHQPETYPWLGFFNKMMLADEYIILDNVQYRKNYFQNRNQFLTKQGAIYLSVPIDTKSNKIIKDIKIRYNEKWQLKHLNTIKQSYSKSKYGDNPLVEPYFANELLGEHIKYEADYSSNKSEVGSNLPDGLGIEIFTFNALEISMSKSSQEHHFEHVNEYILENKKDFKVYKDVNIGGLVDKSHIRLTVDTQEDFERVEKIFKDEKFSIDIHYKDLLENIR